MESFEYFLQRKIKEDDQSGVAPGLGQIDGMPDPSADSPSPGDDAKGAFRDLLPSIQSAVAGPSGRAIISAVVQSIMSDPQVPDRVKTDIQSRVSAKWSHLIDMGSKPVNNNGGQNSGMSSGNTASPIANF